MKAGKLKLTDAFQHQGYWWLPEDPSKQLPGSLSYAPDTGLHLSLVGKFPDPGKEAELARTGSVGDYLGAAELLPIVHGCTSEGEMWTLTECQIRNARYHLFATGSRDLDTCTYRCRFGLVGPKTCTQGLALDVGQWTAGLVGIDHWFGNRSIDVAYNKEQVNFVFTWPDEVRWPWRSGRIEARPGFIAQNHARIIDARQSWDLRGECKTGTHVDRALSQAHQLSLLFGLLVGVAVPIVRFNVRAGQDQYQLYLQPNWDLSSAPEIDSDRDVFLPLPQVSDQMARVVGRWLANADSMSQVYGLASAGLFQKGLPLESRFLVLVQALESFDRHTAPPKQVTLMMRLRRMFDRLPIETRNLLTDDPDALLRTTKETRNYYTHRGPVKRKGTVADSSDLYWLTEALHFWLSIQLLCWAGVGKSVLNRAVQAWRHSPGLAEAARLWRVVE